MTEIRLGPFQLERPIARGGMAEVWRGVHETEQVPVAVKVLTGPKAQDDAFVRALKNEINAVARLEHPGIILLYDRGTVDDDAATNSGGRLVAGSPWFAMEMCSHGALSPRRFPLPWKTSRTLLLSLLDALAHAHARGVVHRDLKPGNILVCAPDDPRPGLKLSDFGIAQPMSLLDEGAGPAHAHSGTPRYMAPEQFDGRARDLGPWTDLYAVGCLAFQLATGDVPFGGDALRLAVAHCHDPVPTLTEKTTHYPAGFEAWVLRLLEKSPLDRFRAAADAAWALLQLTPDEDVTSSSDWEDTLRSLKPRPMFPDDPSSQLSALGTNNPITRGPEHVDDTAAHTVGPPLVEHPSFDDTPAAPPGADESTGPMRVPILPGGATTPEVHRGTDATAAPTAVVRRQGSPRLSIFDTAPTGGPTGGPTGAPEGNRGDSPKLEIADDDPFAAVLGVGDNDDDDGDARDDGTDPRSIAPHAPWTELLEMADKARAESRDTHPTIGGPFSELGNREPRPRHRDDQRLRAPADPPPLPPSWRRADEPFRRMDDPGRLRLLGAGLGLYGLRRPPFVDRLEERDRLWAALRRAAQGNHVVVVIRGAAGLGRTRLLRWLHERANEVGAATTFFAGHSRQTGALDGVVGALARHTRVRREDGLEVIAGAIRNRFDDIAIEDSTLLSRLIAGHRLPADEADAGILRALRPLSRSRPVLMALDDVQWGVPAVAFAERLLASSPPAAEEHGLLLVLAVADEEAAERPDVHAAVEALCGRDDVDVLHLAPLADRDQRRLVAELLGLEPTLAELVAARSAGNPRFAVELVGDLVERKALELLPTGFGLRRDEAMALPDSVHSAWRDRLERLLGQLPPDARICLEVGAVLGTGGNTNDWVQACRAAGVANADDVVNQLVDAMERLRFVISEPGDVTTLRFSNAMLRESMIRLAGEAGRLADHHRAVASTLLGRDDPESAEQRARHLLATGDLDEALPVLFAAIGSALASVGSARASLLVDEAFAALDRGDVPDNDPSWRRAAALRARVLADAGRYDEASMWARLVPDVLEEPALAHQPMMLAAAVDATRALALCALRQGDHDAAVRAYQRLLVVADAGDDDGDDGGDDGGAGLSPNESHTEGGDDSLHPPIAASPIRIGPIGIGPGDNADAAMDGAITEATATVPAVSAANDLSAEARAGIQAGFRDAVDDALMGLADGHFYQGRLDDAAAVLGRALTRCQERGDDPNVSYVLWNLAYVALWRGDPAAARDLLLRAQKIARREGLRIMVALSRNALGDVERVAGRPEDARNHYQEALRSLRRAGSGKVRTVEVNQALCAVVEGRLEDATATAERVLAEVIRTGERVLASLCHGILALAAAKAGDWSDADAHVAAFLAPQQEGLVDGEHALLAEELAKTALMALEPWRAAVATSCAREIWAALGRDDRLEALPVATPHTIH